MAIGISSSYDESSTEYITLNSKKDIVEAYKKLSFRDKRYVELKIRQIQLERIKNKYKNGKETN